MKKKAEYSTGIAMSNDPINISNWDISTNTLEIETKNEFEKIYFFILIGEEKIKIEKTKNIDEFKDFCHYCGDKTWSQLKPVVLDILEKENIYRLDENDIFYCIIQRPFKQ